MKMFFMVTATHVMNMVTKICIADIMQGEMLEDTITSKYVGDVIKVISLVQRRRYYS
jgi:hypothetical protein